MDQQLTDASLKIERAFANAVVGSKDQIDWMTGYLVNAINYWVRYLIVGRMTLERLMGYRKNWVSCDLPRCQPEKNWLI
jgi:hypothetical protein